MRLTIILIFGILVAGLSACIIKSGQNSLHAIFNGKDEVYASGIISTNNFDEFACAFSPDLKQVYFTRTLDNPRRHRILKCELKEGVPQDAVQLFEDNRESMAEPFISADGKYFLFGKLIRSIETSKLESQIWFSKKENNGWSKPKFLLKGMYATMTKNQVVYYTDLSSQEMPVIARAVFNGDSIISTEILPAIINNQFPVVHPFIDPDERFLLFDSDQPKGHGSSDIYISFHKNGHWTKPCNAGTSINSKYYEALPSVSPDGKYLYFTRKEKQSDIYRVETKILSK